MRNKSEIQKRKRIYILNIKPILNKKLKEEHKMKTISIIITALHHFNQYFSSTKRQF